MLTPEIVILALKIAVVGATLVLCCSLTALAMGRYRLHGRINLLFFILVLAALLGFELTAHIAYPGMLQDYLRERVLSMCCTFIWAFLCRRP